MVHELNCGINRSQHIRLTTATTRWRWQSLGCDDEKVVDRKMLSRNGMREKGDEKTNELDRQQHIGGCIIWIDGIEFSNSTVGVSNFCVCAHTQNAIV